MSGKRSRLSPDEIKPKLAALQDWSIAAEKLHREYRFASFVEAFGFMTSAALVAESMNHHPEWFNVYSTVRIDLSTHDARRITQMDFDLAEKMEAIAAKLARG
jgi:4a-hydroxytetrahydrobiopterin dehydratase